MQQLLLVLVFLTATAVFAAPNANWELLTTRGAPPSPRNAMAATALGDTIYTFGGFQENLDPANPMPNTFYNEVFTFKVPAKRWNLVGTLPDAVNGYPAPRAFSIAGRDGNDFIVGFGITYTADFSSIETFNDLWSLDTSSRRWKMLRANNNVGGPSQRADVTAVVQNGKIFLFGGVTSQFETMGDTWVYEIDSNLWTQIVTPTAPSPRYGTISALDRDGQRMWVYGGERSSFTPTGIDFSFAGPDALWYLDLCQETWVARNPVPNIPNRNNGNGAVFAHDKLMLFGGDIGGGQVCPNVIFQQNNVRETWAYDADDNEWTHLCPATSPPNLKRASSVLVGDTIYLFGGFAYDSTTCGPFLFNQNVWAYKIKGSAGGVPC